MLLGLGLLACASGGQRAALGWSLGGEAHVFFADDGVARDFYRELTGSGRLQDTLEGRRLVAVEPRSVRGATVLSARGAAPARLTLVRFHAPQTCGSPAVVTELVLAFSPAGPAGRSLPPSHVSVVALLDKPPFARGPGPQVKQLSRAKGIELVQRVAVRAEPNGTLLGSLTLDPDKAADAGEVVAIGKARYAVGFRVRVLTTGDDTLLVTGVAVTDTSVHDLRWVVRPLRLPLTDGMTGSSARRYSLRGTVAGPGSGDGGGGTLLLLDEIADVSPRDSRATAVDPESRRVLATQPLALQCP